MRISPETLVDVVRDPEGRIVLTSLGTVRMRLTDAGIWLATMSARLNRAIEAHESHFSFPVSVDARFDNPRDADRLANELFEHANDDKLNAQAYHSAEVS